MEDKYKDYSATDLAADYHFVHWVNHPNEDINQRWNYWLKEHPEMRSTVNEARALVRSVELPHYPGLRTAVDQVWNRISATNAQDEIPSEYIHPSSRRTWWRWAAVFIGFLLVAGGVLYTLNTIPDEYHTAYGETKEINLPDGSIVTLNANSTLRLGSWEHGREVWLKGEAFFSVQKQQNESGGVKFIVHASDVDVSVLGTKFTVSDHRTTTVVLNEGKIQLTLGKENILMKPGDFVEVSRDKTLVKKTVNPRVYSSWKDKEWVLDGLTLKEIAKRLEDTFGMKVQIRNQPDPSTKVTGVVPTDNLDKLLMALSAVFERDFKRVGNEIIIE